MKSKSLIKEAEQQVVNRAIQLREINKIISALSNFGYKYCSKYVAQDDFEKGISLIRKAVYQEYANACADLVIFKGVGGKEAEKFCQDEFKRIFSDEQRFAIMGFLESNGSCPGSYLLSEEEQMREEAREIINGFNDED